MLHHSRYLVACCGGALALAAFVIGLEVSSTTAAPSSNPTAANFNRTLKGDRLPLTASKQRNAINGPVGTPPPTPRSELLEGCEPLVSAIGQPPLSRVAGRCLS